MTTHESSREIRPDSVLGAVFECAGGHIVTLPNFERLNEQEFLTACRAYRCERQEANPPIWIPAYICPESTTANSRITGFQVEIKRLQQKRASELAEREELLGYKDLLLSAGQGSFGGSGSKSTRTCSGFLTSPSEDLPGYPIEISGKVRGVCMSGALQVKASQRQISCAEFLGLTPKLAADGQHTQFRGKAYLLATDSMKVRLAPGWGRSCFLRRFWKRQKNIPSRW